MLADAAKCALRFKKSAGGDEDGGEEAEKLKRSEQVITCISET